MNPHPLGIRLLIAFFVVAALICAASTFTLAFPGTALDILWRVKPEARVGFLQMGAGALLLLGVVGAVMCTAAAGLWRLQPWGWWAAVGAFTANALSDGIHAFVASDHREVIGLPIAASLVWYLCRPRIRQLYRIGRRG